MQRDQGERLTNPDGFSPHEPLRSNRQVEDAAVAFVIDQEVLEGRSAHDTRHRGAAGDLVSGDRVVEVKAFGTSARGQDLWLEVRQVEEARANPTHFWLYIVENLRQGDPAYFRLLRFGGEPLARLLDRAVEHRYFTVPFPVAVHDTAVIEQSQSPG